MSKKQIIWTIVGVLAGFFVLCQIVFAIFRSAYP